MVIKISETNANRLLSNEDTPLNNEASNHSDKKLKPAYDHKKWDQLQKGIKKEKSLPNATTKKVPTKPFSFSHLKLNFKTTRVMGLLTNSIYELQSAIKNDYENKTFYQTPRTILGETMGWASSAVGGALAFAVSGNTKITEFVGMGAYAMGREVGQNAIDDQKYFWSKNMDVYNNSYENHLDRILQGVNIAALGPVAGVYTFARLTKE